MALRKHARNLHVWFQDLIINPNIVCFMGIASIKFKNGDMEAMGKNLGGAVCLFLVPKIVEVILAWAAQ